MPSAEPGRISRWRRQAFIAMQYFLPHHLVTRCVGWLMAREQIWLKNLVIRSFSKAFAVATSEASKPVPEGYSSMNAFFTRELKPGVRPIDGSDDALVAPCDGVISQCGTIEAGQILQAKGFRYSVADFLKNDALAAELDGGLFMTIYLAPYDYHRVHMPVGASIIGHQHIPGALFSVNGATAAAVPRLFARNERRVFTLRNDTLTAALVMVGALNVGSISTAWSDDTPQAGSIEKNTEFEIPPKPLARGDTVGWFNMGSTVVLLLPADVARWSSSCKAGAVLRMGEPIGVRTEPT